MLPEFSPSLMLPIGPEGLCCLWLRGHCCLKASLRSLNKTLNMFSFGEKTDWA